jgi:hypothetical protein
VELGDELEPGCEPGEVLFVLDPGFVEFTSRSVLLELGLLLFVELTPGELTLGLLGVVLLPGVVLGVDDEPG